MEDIAADIARAVDEELRYIREVLGDGANLNSPRLDLYHAKYKRGCEHFNVTRLTTEQRHAIWDSICPPDAIDLASRKSRPGKSRLPLRSRLTLTESATSLATSQT